MLPISPQPACFNAPPKKETKILIPHAKFSTLALKLGLIILLLVRLSLDLDVSIVLLLLLHILLLSSCGTFNPLSLLFLLLSFPLFLLLNRLSQLSFRSIRLAL
ncbi:hypothetical protein E6O75_ATG04506 [Venturia nashicola]|uniref:Uncharacterized protein n=1 Tax=Venturia nashicola TaxID=86259 RepID=A0A4Z1PIC2_9PEZI|nr:hypothetical protein E6O75_ATG04506 [Venturia nashicola]